MRALRGHRRRLALLAACLVALGSAAGLATGLVADPLSGQPRPLTAAEAGRLATMRLYNHQDGRVGLRGAFGRPGERLQVYGWVDWQRPLVYLSVTGQRPGPSDRLVQALPALIAYRPGRLAAEPPLEPPADGWRVRPAGSTRSRDAPLDTVLALVFSLAANRTDPADPLVGGEARWLRRDRVEGVPVDVLRGPAGAVTGPVRYWLDSASRLRRLETVIDGDAPLRLDFARTDRPDLVAVAELGGDAISPRRVTTAEALLLARLRQRNRAAGGGSVTVALPTDGTPVTATGWLDWRNKLAYLAVRDTGSALVRADRAGVAVLAGAAPDPDGRPPVPAPRGGWLRATWQQRGDGDLDLLLNEAIRLSAAVPDDADELRAAASWLRADTLRDLPVTVFEMPKPAERGLPAGAARLRYWVDGSGVLCRLEVRGRSGGFGRLDITPGDPVPHPGAVR